jgi:hypothetical protein
MRRSLEKGMRTSRPAHNWASSSPLGVDFQQLMEKPGMIFLRPRREEIRTRGVGSQVNELRPHAKDPKLLSGTTSYPMVWKSFMRGLNPIYLESDLPNASINENVNGYTRKL